MVKPSILEVDAKPAERAADVDDAEAPEEEEASRSTIVEPLVTD